MVCETRLYDLLEVEPIATADELKQGWKKMTRKYHPDKNPTGTEQMKDINFAYATLTNKATREVYDLFGEEGVDRYNKGESLEMDRILSDKEDTNGVRLIKYHMNVTLEELYKGSTRTVFVKTSVDCKECDDLDSCEKCNGKKKLEKQHKVHVIIPVGAPNKLEIVYDLTFPGSQPINFTVLINELKNSTFERSGDDLKIKVTMHVAEAASYFKKTIKTLDDRILLIRSKDSESHMIDVIANGRTDVVTNEGMPKFNKPNEKGVLHVTFCVKHPESVTNGQINVINRCLVPKSTNSDSTSHGAKDVELVTLPEAETRELTENFAKLFAKDRPRK